MFRILFASTMLASALPTYAYEPIKGLIGFDAGYSRRTAPSAEAPLPELEPYVEELRTGWSSGLTAAKFFGETYGFGVQFNMFSTSNEDKDIVIPLEGNTFVGTSDDMTMWFLGPVFLSQNEFANGKVVVTGQLGLGYFGYSNASTLGQANFDITASTLAFTAGLQVGHRISELLLVGAHARYLAGSFDEVEVDGREAKLPQKESIARIDFGIFVAFAITSQVKLKSAGEGSSPGLRPLPQSRPAPL